MKNKCFSPLSHKFQKKIIWNLNALTFPGSRLFCLLILIAYDYHIKQNNLYELLLKLVKLCGHSHIDIERELNFLNLIVVHSRDAKMPVSFV